MIPIKNISFRVNIYVVIRFVILCLVYLYNIHIIYDCNFVKFYFSQTKNCCLKVFKLIRKYIQKVYKIFRKARNYYSILFLHKDFLSFCQDGATGNTLILNTYMYIYSEIKIKISNGM